jgi:hypothetical protein
MAQTVGYDANGLLAITVTDQSPYDPVNHANDCDHSGTFNAGDDQDCDNNGARDVLVQVRSAEEFPGEWVILNETAPSSGVFKGNLPYSTLYNSPGTIFGAKSGTTDPTFTATYFDLDDGSPSHVPCANTVNTAGTGQLIAVTTVTHHTSEKRKSARYSPRASLKGTTAPSTTRTG